MQPEHVRQWDRAIQAKGSLTFADWKTAAVDSTEVRRDAEVTFGMEQTSTVTQQMLAAAQLHGRYVVAEFHALHERAHTERQESSSKINNLQKATEELQKAMEEQGKAANVLKKELHETRAICAEAQQAAQFKTTELEASSQVTKDLQEQLAQLTTETAAFEQRLQAKSAESVSLHDNAMASVLQTHDLKTKNSRLEQEVGHLRKSLAEATQLNCKRSQFQSAKDVAAAALTSLSEVRRDFTELQQELSSLKDNLAEADALQKCDVKSSQLAQQDAELAAVKQEVASRLAAHQELERVATDMTYELQEQCGQTTLDLHAAKEQISELQTQLAGKRDEVTSEMSETISAQLQQQLAHLKQELSQAQRSKHEATKEAHKRLVQLLLKQKDLDRKVTDIGCLQLKQTCLHADLDKLTKAKEDDMEQMEDLKSQLTAALANRDGAVQELTEWRNKMEGRAGRAQGRGQGPAARLAGSGTSVQSHRSSGPSSPATPPDEPKARPSVFTRLSQGSAICGGVGVFHAPGVPDMPPGLGNRGVVLDAPGLVHQAVHQHFVLVGQGGDWKLARLEKAAPMNSSLDESMVCEGIEAPEMAQQQRNAGYYYPNPKQDMWSFGLLLFSVFKGMGRLPHEHQLALKDGTTLLFASKLCGQARYTEWRHKVERTMKLGKLSPELIKIVLGCLAKDPDQRLTAARVVATLTELCHKNAW
ncbi:MAG: hypothetical protein FRX49_04482 [Trebouxia sp. A1-2]|nr:MAG: hypothetical protein FRX49_04482 [Trebouxia sp. A1-2]